MTRIAIIGNAGGGKSTLARQLHARLNLPLHAVDRIQWRPGWQPSPADEVADVHATWINSPRWIIDGWGDWPLIEARFARADTIIFVDFPLWRHTWWAIKRQFFCLFRPRIDGPAGCPMIPKTWALMKMMRHIDLHALPRLRSLLVSSAPQVRIHRLRRPCDISAFLKHVQTSR